MQTGPLPAKKDRISRNAPAKTPKPNKTLAIGHPPDNQTPTSRLPEDISDSVSHTLVSPNPDSVSPVTNDTSVDDMIVDEVGEVLPTTTTTPSALCDSMIQIKFIPKLGISALTQTPPPALLFVDQDKRPDWLLIAVREFLQNGPYYLCLNKVVDLFLTQEARLGYPSKVRSSNFFTSSPVDFMNSYSPLVVLYRLSTGLPK